MSYLFGTFGSPPPSGSYNLEFDFEPKAAKTKKKRCECGSDVTYGKGNSVHADYCPKYERKK